MKAIKEINGHEFEIDFNIKEAQITVVWKSYMNLKFDFWLEHANNYYPELTGITHTVNLFRHDGSNYRGEIETFDFFEENELVDIETFEKKVFNKIYEFTQTY